MIHSPALLHLFGRQHGLATNTQLLQHLSQRQLRRAVDLGLYVVELPKVKRLAGTTETDESRVIGLSLYAGDTGFVSGVTAARQLGVDCVPRTVFEIMVKDSRDPRLPKWATSTRSSWRMVSDRQELADGRIVSTPLRTLFRCSATCNDVRFEKIAEQMWHRQLISPTQAEAYLTSVRRQGRHGVLRFERWLERAIERPSPAQSGLEVDMATTLGPLNIPEPLRQFPLQIGDELIHLDLAWPDAKLGVEPGATWWHGGDAKARSDHQRDRACDEIGWRVLRFDEVELRDINRCARQVVTIYRDRARLQLLAGKGAL